MAKIFNKITRHNERKNRDLSNDFSSFEYTQCFDLHKFHHIGYQYANSSTGYAILIALQIFLRYLETDERHKVCADFMHVGGKLYDRQNVGGNYYSYKKIIREDSQCHEFDPVIKKQTCTLLDL